MIPHEQEFELYHYAESFCSQKARLGFAEKQLPFKSCHTIICDVAVDCQNLDNDYLKINPKGIVPTLVHNGEAIYDAHRIIKYIDEQYPDSGIRLWPEDPGKEKIARFWFEEGMLDDSVPFASTFGTSVPVLTLPILETLLKRQPLEVVLNKFKKHPLEQRAHLFTSLRAGDFVLPEEDVNHALTTLCKGLITLSRNLDESGGPWVLGDFSTVDITVIASFHRLEDVHLDALLDDEKISGLGDYWRRLKDRPSYKEAVLDWHDEENFRTAIVEIYGDEPSPLMGKARAILSSL